MTASPPVLYSFRRCPFAIRARLALAASRVRVELREVALRSKPAELLALSPKGTVPVLSGQGGLLLQESLDIMDWALAQSDPLAWRAPDGRIGAAEQSWIDANDGPFKRLLDGYKYPGRHPECAEGQCRDEAVELHLAPLEHRLAAQPFLRGGQPGRADMALLPFVRQFAMVDEAWWAGEAPLPALRRWLSVLLDSAVFRAALHDKLAPWQPGDPPRFFF